MKRFDPKQREIWKRVSRFRWYARLKRQAPVPKRKPRQLKSTGTRKTIRAPVEIRLSGGGIVDLTNFIQSIYSVLLRQSRQVELDFSQTLKVAAEGMVLLWAELHRLLKFAAMSEPISMILPDDKKVQQVFKQIDLCGLLGVPIDIEPVDDDVIHWRAAKGRKAEGQIVPGILGRIEGTLANSLKTGLFAGITEAMINSKHHAYLEPRGDGFGHHPELEWWMFSQERDDHLTLVICDLGIGIPRSLPLTMKDDRPFLSRLKRWYTKQNYDGRAIREAILIGATRTKEGGRGYGLSRNIKPVIEKWKQGRLGILSNSGAYFLEIDEAGNSVERTRALEKSILGTIIYWRVPIKNLQGN